MLTLLCVLVAHDGLHDHSNEHINESRVEVVIAGDKRIVRANSLPDHTHGEFPTRGNPNEIRPQRTEVSMPAEPSRNAAITPLRFPGKFGIAVNGVLFDPQAAEWWQRNPRSGWTYEPLGPLNYGGRSLGMDASHAHVQPSGAYHYHGVPTALVENLFEQQGESSDIRPAMVKVGWAADGFPIYAARAGQQTLQPSYRLKQGTRPSGPRGRYDGTFVEDWEYVEGLGDLDEANGRTAPTPDAPDGEYHYVLTDTFPFVPRGFAGTPDPSFAPQGRGGPPQGRGGPPGRGRPPRGFGPPGGGRPGGPPPRF